MHSAAISFQIEMKLLCDQFLNNKCTIMRQLRGAEQLHCSYLNMSGFSGENKVYFSIRAGNRGKTR